MIRRMADCVCGLSLWCPVHGWVGRALRSLSGDIGGGR